MNIAVATNNHQSVAGHVGRCRGFIIYHTEGKLIKNKGFRENTFTQHRQGTGHNNHHHGGSGRGNGHKRLIEGLADCHFLIFKSGGWRMIDDLKANNIQPILTDEKSADEVVKKFINGELKQKEVTGCSEHERN